MQNVKALLNSEAQTVKDDNFHVKANEWHQIVNRTKQPCHIIEIQYGDETSEDDIERLHYYNGE